MASIKSIRFNDQEETTLLVHAEKYGRNFASYVKDLIIRDMESRGAIMDKEEIKKIVMEILYKSDLSITEEIVDESPIADDFESALADMGLFD